MPRETINDAISIAQQDQDISEGEVVIDVDNVSVVFNMASEQLNSLKEYFIALAKGELRFKELRALKGVSFSVRKGDVFGILGTNGSGKSTMLKVIAGVLEPSGGSCTVKGQIAPLIELGAGFDMDLTARENVYLNGALLGYDKKFVEQHFDDIIEFAEVQDFLDIPLKNYSSGMVARIAFAIATIIVPEVLIVDEVLSVGDFMFQQKCEERIRSLIQDHHVTVLIVSHNTDQVKRLCNRAIWIEKGNTRIQGSAEQVCELYNLLGGRTGNAESEGPIIDTYTFEYEVPKETQSTVFGLDRYDTALKLFKMAEGIDTDSLVLMNSTKPYACGIATAVAGLLNTSPLFCLDDQVPSATKLAIMEHRPSTIYVIGAAELTEQECLQSVEGADYHPRIVMLESSVQQAPRIYDYFAQSGHTWGATAVVLDATDESAELKLTLISPFIHSAHAPLFVAESVDALADSEPMLARCERIVFLGSEGAVAQHIGAFAEARGIELIDFADAPLKTTNAQINAWIDSEWQRAGASASAGAGASELVITSPFSNVDNELIGAYAGTAHALLLMEDTSNLDSTASALTYVRDHASRIDHITFLGSENRFDTICRQLIGKAHGMGMQKVDDPDETE